METVGDGDLVALAAVAASRAARIVISGATSGPNPPADLSRIFFLQLPVVGSTMGTRAELADLMGVPARDRAAPAHRSRTPARASR